MNYSKNWCICQYTTLDLGHWKFAARYTPRLQLEVYLAANCLWPRSQVVGIYTSLLWFIYYIYKSLPRMQPMWTVWSLHS